MFKMPRRRRSLAALVALLALVVGTFLASGTSPASAASTGRSAWIVVLKGEPSARSAAVASQHAARYGAEVRYTYAHALNGYAAVVPDARIAQLRRDPAVAAVVRDGTAYATTTQSNPPSWGLDRIDQRTLPLSSSYTYTSTGAGVTAYLLDTGINYAHTDFGGRAVFGFDAFGGDGTDCNGHGSHVSGTVGGTRYGVAKSVRLVAVRVLNCSGSGSWSGVIAGIDWVAGNHAAGAPAVANMSLGGAANSAVDDAVARAVADGVTFAVAAGNSTADACTQSPARTPSALTIAASDISDRPASFTNFGSCVDWYAPGVNITSAWKGSTTASKTISGTSMASPHTAGVAALYLQTSPSASPAQVESALRSLTTKDAIPDSRTANNDLLFTNF
ncbi:MAG TPA: S8 family peptidase [Acidimicrobiales bacterium]